MILGISATFFVVGAVGFCNTWLKLRQVTTPLQEACIPTKAVLTPMQQLQNTLKQSCLRMLFAAFIPVTLSQGPSSPAQFAILLIQTILLGVGLSDPHCEQPRWRAILPAMIYWATNAGFHFYVSGTNNTADLIQFFAPSVVRRCVADCGQFPCVHFPPAGHDHTFSTIQFSCAYVGLHEFHPVFSAVWSVLNVGAYHVVHVICLAFLAVGYVVRVLFLMQR